MRVEVGKEHEPYTPRKVISRVDRINGSSKKEDTASAPDSADKESWEPKKSRKTWKWVFRLLVVPMLCILITYAGMVAGYVVLGNGTVSEAMRLDTWTHVFKLVFG